MENENELKGGPTTDEIYEFIDRMIAFGKTFTAQDVCVGVGAYNRNEKKNVYVALHRFAKKEIIKPDQYKNGGFRKVLHTKAYDLGGPLSMIEKSKISQPLELDNLLNIEPNQLVVISGRFDAGKSSFLFDIMQRNFTKNQIYYFASLEWSLDAIKERMDLLCIPRPHPNIHVYPMDSGYEDLIPKGPCVVCVDYIRTNENPYEIDVQFYRILENLKGGICFAAIQKHVGLDKPVGGGLALHAPHHMIFLDKMQSGDFICKMGKTKNSKDLEGVYRTFKFNDSRKIVPIMDTWKKGEIRWDKKA